MMERKLAYLSLVFAFVHFCGETYWHVLYGQFLPMLIVDYIAIGLLVYGAFRTLSNAKLVGLLCGAWGFAFCLNYRALFHRIEKLMDGVGHGDPSIDVTAYVLAGVLLVSVSMFIGSMRLTSKQAKGA